MPDDHNAIRVVLRKSEREINFRAKSRGLTSIANPAGRLKSTCQKVAGGHFTIVKLQMAAVALQSADLFF